LYPAAGVAVSTGTAWDLSVSSSVSGQVVTWNGTNWTAQTPAGVTVGKSIAMALIFGF
jgi:hypothetical protein